ncbi:ABC transporter ATP-binding protein [Neobacillus niacini]|uniref:ABC transporter ATP-binding protein n=1 Tax=Neobacillus niacini TaxID=86668 RepID=UPI0021CB8150|nr:ABC transporter ATP-binding protein [Neobacillus niacini]MCM3766198.1 ABC transporter ATP-binding protein [Neobacillus niacini]
MNLVILEIKNIDVYYGDLQVINNLSLSIEEGGITSIVGANGAGKSTLMNCILGAIKPKRGKINFNGQDITSQKTFEIVERGISLVPEGRGLFPFLTVEENLILGAISKHAKSKTRENLDRVYSLFPRLKERSKQRAGSLSGGEQQMCSIGRALIAEPKVILLDEPSLGLAPIMVKTVMDTIEQLAMNGYTIILVEQNVMTSLGISKKGYVLQEGRVVMEGSGAALLANDELRKSYLGV